MIEKLPDDPDFVSKIDESLDMFEKDLAGFPKWKNMEAPEYLDISLDQLRRKTPEELSEAVFILQQYSLNVQRLINKFRAWERWCNSMLDRLEAENLEFVPTHYGFNERPKIARNNPAPCRKINEFLRKVRMQLDRIYGLPDQINLMANCIRDMKFLASQREKQYAKGD